jgi:phosphoglycerol transferase MdoB-like AlkP superfamily enzyme
MFDYRKIKKEIFSGYFLKFFLFYQLFSRSIITTYAIKFGQIDVFEITNIFLSGFIIDIAAAILAFVFLRSIRIILLPLLRINYIATIFEFICFILLNLILTLNLTGEVIFWDEFGSRYNFIAVDYLVYTHEIVNTLKESVPVPAVLAVISLYLLIITYAFRDQISAYSKSNSIKVFQYIILVISSLIIGKFFNPESVIFSSNNFVREIAKNGPYEFVYAFFNNELDYNKFYKNIDSEKAIKIVKESLEKEPCEFYDDNSIKRKILAKDHRKKPNFVVILVESLSAEFMTEFGNTSNITPFLDELAQESVFFKNAYATGTRTVRGLEALTKSIPPTPGSSILRRPNNENIFTISSVLKPMGYDMEFIYGGYSYFDNMKHFFSNNGFNITDRSDFDSSEISFANVWGISDSDVAKKLIKTLDKKYEDNKPFFSLFLTTSNHRPYTFPVGHIDLPSGSRSAAVKYTDHAIKQLIEEAKKKDWFDNTIFVILADHCASSAGKTKVPVNKYHIPIILYAPKLLEPKNIDYMISQIDLAPTLLGIIGEEYDSEFFGLDALSAKPDRAFISTYQLLGFMDESKNPVVLEPKDEIASNPNNESLIDSAISFYQTGFNYFKNEQSNKSFNTN